METSLSVGNDAVLRSARRWIIAAYVWQILTNLYQLAFPFLLQYVNANHDTIHVLIEFHVAFLVFCDLVFLTVLSIGVLKLKKHSFPRFRMFAILIVIGVGVPIIVSLLSMLVIGIERTSGSLHKIFDTIWLFVYPLAGYLLCVAYVYLLKNDVINAVYRSVIAILCLAVFVGTAMNLSFWVGITFDYLDSNQRIMFGSGCTAMLQIIFVIVNIASILAYKNLLATPSDIPAVEDTPATFSFRPSKIEIGFIVSVALSVILTYVFVKTILV